MKIAKKLMFCKLTFLMLLSIFVTSCSEYQIDKVPSYEPEILISPSSQDFGILFSGQEIGEATFTIQNVGTGELIIEDFELSDEDQDFYLQELSKNVIAPGEIATLTVTYEPETYQINYDEIAIYSNDLEQRKSTLTLDGMGSAPVLSIDPSEFDFADIYYECPENIELTITNLGDLDLVIDDINYFSSLPSDFYPDYYEDLNGPLPWIIPQNQSMVFSLVYSPEDLLDDSGYFLIESNDPMRPEASVSQDGNSLYQDFETDISQQEATLPVDILFVVDNSCSMAQNQLQLANNFNTFMNVFTSSSIDYRIAFITTDRFSFVNGIITPATPDPVSHAMDQINRIGIRGSGVERGFYTSKMCFTSGPCAPGGAFFRELSNLVVIYVSDEDDYSSMNSAEMEAFFVNLKGSKDYVVTHAVVGDVPSGCVGNGNASAGFKYNELVTRMMGTTLSICAIDWGTPMEQLANDSFASPLHYLSKQPVESTITVLVDGVSNSDWIYKESLNAVLFNVAPTEGAVVQIDYAVKSICNEEENNEN
jgi:hypothetical protein